MQVIAVLQVACQDMARMGHRSDVLSIVDRPIGLCYNQIHSAIYQYSVISYQDRWRTVNDHCFCNSTKLDLSRSLYLPMAKFRLRSSRHSGRAPCVMPVGQAWMFDIVNKPPLTPSTAPIAEGVLSQRLTDAAAPQDFRQIAVIAEAAQQWAIRERVAYRGQHYYGCIRLDALRALAKAVDRIPRLGRGRPKNVSGGNIKLPTLQELLDTATSQQARTLHSLAHKIADVAEPIYRKYLAEADRQRWTVSPTGLLEFAAPITRSQHFTDQSLARRLYRLTLDVLANHGITVGIWIEPSAGDGAFYDLLPEGRRIGIDIDPRRKEFIAGDFLQLGSYKPGIIYGAIGNPPWTHNGCVKFFNHAAKGCTVIAFLLPRSFEGHYRSGQLDPRFTLLHSESLPTAAFRFGKKGQVFASLFQIWVKTTDIVEHLSADKPVKSHKDFDFLPRSSDYRQADIIIRRVGTDAGRILDAGEIPTIANCHLIRVAPGADVAQVRARLAAITRDDPKYLNAATGHAERGYKAISMAAIVAEYDRVSDLSLWSSLTRSLIKQEQGENMLRNLMQFLAEGGRGNDLRRYITKAVSAIRDKRPGR